MRNESLSSRVFDVFNIFLMIAIFLVMFYPFLYILNYSLSDALRVKAEISLLPWGFSLASYRAFFLNPDVLQGLFISVARSIVGTFATMFVICIGAYAISKDKVPGIKLTRKFIIFTLYFGGGLIPFYLVLKSLGLIGTFWLYIIPNLVNVFALILIRAFIDTLPPDLEESATIDGANEFQVFWKVLFPICLPVVAVMAVFTFLGQWNAIYDTILFNYMNRDLYTLQFYLYMFLTTSSAVALEQAKEYGQAVTATSYQTNVMAVTVITILPILVVYPFAQRYIRQGLLVGAIKA